MKRNLKITFSLALAMVSVPFLVLAQSTANHATFKQLEGPFSSGPEVTKACLECHTQAAEQIQQTSHWTWAFDVGFEDKILGKKNVINNFCISTASNEPRCTSCHVGYGWKDNTFDHSKQENVDCLACHDNTGEYKKFPTDAGHPNYTSKEWPKGSGKIRQPVDLKAAAQSVGDPSRETCGACHFYGGGGDGVKHGDMDSSLVTPNRALDVHMSPDGANFACQDCHTTTGHQTAGSRYLMNAKDIEGVDFPGHGDQTRASCESCHGLEPHQGNRLANRLNEHVANIACSTCHVPEYARENKTKTQWDWSTAGDKSRPTSKDDEGYTTYTPEKGDFVWERNVVPDYACFNGEMSYTTIGEKITPNAQGVVELTQPQGRCGDDDSRVWPFKIMRSKQPYDTVNQIMVTPHLFGKDENAYWKHLDWDKAATAGMAATGNQYSGDMTFVDSVYHFPIVHMVAPKEQALKCGACHTEDGRLAKLSGFYMPAQTSMSRLDTIGWLIVLMTLLGVIGHALMRAKGKSSNQGDS
ncbi:tetrathionate reductase family octaheme c-type cytochrome [Vibrio aestuarianus]|uniref:tetrathionate reductase family octaheme c-type cytochrome n=1 Tax=Vibrio aestuarianus TaxID=28171 RepID=UPI00237CBF23|nr:tetrathionate reductase family octaheme c-type cytochrome [Vibrio aestuarianus]MDE1264893.1 tetrathionate reductase family octaheme c-type cytochrome [Vibrio aestuarianus]MDE1296821.1 tetrathionate reductase family octaheme c-type cytochrome [Vibrio aestuarianus]